jgi:hypothetical protein
VTRDQQPGQRGQGGSAPSREEAVAVISAYGAFRLLIILLAIWSFIEGFALFTGGLNALTFGGNDRTAERVVGAQLIVFVPVYALLAWQRERYRLLIWVPYGAQLAIILPTLWSLLHGDTDGLLLLVVSSMFFALLFYFWWHSHPLDFFRPGDGEEEGFEEEYEEEEDEDAERDDDARRRPSTTGGERDGEARGRRYRRLPPKQG